MQVTYEGSQAEADNIITFFFRPEKPVHYTAGQFTELTLPHTHSDDRGSKRWFTLSSSPNDALLSITTKFAAKHGSTFKHALSELQPGTQYRMEEPMGDFVLPKLIQTPLVFVAAGIGVTPFHSMLKWLSQTGETRPIKLLYAVHSEDEIVFTDTFDLAGISPTIVVSQPTAAWGGQRGQLSAETILGLEQPSDDTLVYLSGPESFVEDLERDLKKAGLKKSQLATDFFPNYSEI